MLIPPASSTKRRKIEIPGQSNACAVRSVPSLALRKPAVKKRPHCDDDNYVPKENAVDSDEDFFPDDHAEPHYCDLCGHQQIDPLKPLPGKEGLFVCSICFPRRRKPVRQSGMIVIDDDESYSRRGKRTKHSCIVPRQFLPYVIKQERDRGILMTCQFCGWRKTYGGLLCSSKNRPDLQICKSCRRCENRLGVLHPRQHSQRRLLRKQKRTADRGTRFYSSGTLMFEPVVTENTIAAGPIDYEKIKKTQMKFRHIDLDTQVCLRPELLEKVRVNCRLYPNRPPVAQKYFSNCEHKRTGGSLFANLSNYEETDEISPPELEPTQPVENREVDTTNFGGRKLDYVVPQHILHL